MNPSLSSGVVFGNGIWVYSTLGLMPESWEERELPNSETGKKGELYAPQGP